MKIVQTENIRMILNDSDCGDKVYLTFTVHCGFCCRAVYFPDTDELREANQAFPNTFAHYITDYYLQNFQKSLTTEIFRSTISFVLQTDTKNVFQDMERIHSVLFDLQPEESLFETAKEKTILSFTAKYKDVKFRALYKMLEFSESGKSFHYTKLAKDMQELDYKTFCNSMDLFVRPEHSVLFLAGDASGLLPLPELNLKKRETNGDAPLFVFQEKDVTLQTDCHFVKPDMEDYRMACVKFFFANSQISQTERYFLLSMLAGLMLQTDYDVNVDAADASILYWNRQPEEFKYRIPDFLKSDETEACRKRLLASLNHTMENNPQKFYAQWGNLLMNGIELHGYLHLLETGTGQTLLDLYEKSDLFVREAQIILQNVVEGK